MDNLLSIQKQIQASVPANSADYMNLLRQWLGNRITLEVFDQRAQKLIPIDLHTKFLLSVVSVFDPQTFGSNEAELHDRNFSTRATVGFLPTKHMIYSLGVIVSLDYGFKEEADKDIAPFVQNHIKTMMANILESVLKMSRSFVCTESGFAHSFGIQKSNPPRTSTSNFGQNAPSGAVPICLPAKEPINSEDLLDCLDLDFSLVPHIALRDRLVKRLENIDTSSRMCSTGSKTVVKKE